MTFAQAFEQIKKGIVDDNLTITSLAKADQLHQKFIALRTELYLKGIISIMPHYRGEQYYGWDITSGIFRPPLHITSPTTGKTLEQYAINEFEKTIQEKVGPQVLRDVFNKEKHGKDWDLLFQAQHAGIKTTLTDWSAHISSALYFATEESPDNSIEESDGQLWCFLAPTDMILGHNNYPDRKSFYDIDPFSNNSTYLINPSSFLDGIQDRIFEYRMYRQRGRFVIPAHDSCHIPLNQHPELAEFILKARVPSKFKEKIRAELLDRKISRTSMYIEEDSNRQKLITEVNSTIYGL